jgi:hypothetical protein
MGDSITDFRITNDSVFFAAKLIYIVGSADKQQGKGYCVSVRM